MRRSQQRRPRACALPGTHTNTTRSVWTWPELKPPRLWCIAAPSSVNLARGRQRSGSSVRRWVRCRHGWQITRQRLEAALRRPCRGRHNRGGTGRRGGGRQSVLQTAARRQSRVSGGVQVVRTPHASPQPGERRAAQRWTPLWTQGLPFGCATLTRCGQPQPFARLRKEAKRRWRWRMGPTALWAPTICCPARTRTGKAAPPPWTT